MEVIGEAGEALGEVGEVIGEVGEVIGEEGEDLEVLISLLAKATSMDSRDRKKCCDPYISYIKSYINIFLFSIY